MAVTLRNLRLDTLRGYRERQIVTGSVFTGATGSLIIDPNRQEPDGEWDRVDSYILFTSGIWDNTERRVTGWSAGNSSVTFAPALSPSVGSGNTYHLYKTFPQLSGNLAINSALRDSFPNRVIEGFATGAETADSYRLTVPSAAGGPQAQLVRVERSVGTTNSDWNFDILDEGVDYIVERDGNTATLILANIGASGYVNRFHFRRPAGEMTADTDTTDEPPHLIHLAGRKFLALAEGDDAGVAKWTREFAIAQERWVKNRSARAIKYPRISIGH